MSSWRDRATKVSDDVQPVLNAPNDWRSRATKVEAAPDEGGTLPKALASYAMFMGPEGNYGANPAGKAMSLVSKPFQKGGEMLADTLGSHGVDPRLAAGAGTVVQMAPDIATSLIMPPESKEIPEAAQSMAGRAMGATKRFRQTPFARGQVAQAGKTALENDIIPYSGNPTTMMSRAQQLTTNAGRDLGQMREALGKFKLDPIYDGLDALRERVLQGRTGGQWDVIANKINNAQETLLGLLNRTGDVTLNQVAEAKKAIKGAVNYATDNVTQGAVKSIVSQIEQGMSDAFAEGGGDVGTYKGLKQVYGAGKNMMKYLNNEISGQEGNNLGGLVSHVYGAGQLMTGSPMKAAEAFGASELLKKRGAGVSARLLTDLYNTRGSTNLIAAFKDYLRRNQPTGGPQ